MRLVPRGVGHAVQQPCELPNVLLYCAVNLQEIPQFLFEFLPGVVREEGLEQQVANLDP